MAGQSSERFQRFPVPGRELRGGCIDKLNSLGHEWDFLIKTMPEASGASSRWLRSVSDDTTGRRRDIRLCPPLPGCQQLFLDLMTGRFRFAQPPATRFDASGIILLRDVSFLTATSLIRGLSRSLSSLVMWICRNAYWNRNEANRALVF